MKTNNIENNLKTYRKKNGYTQKQVGILLGFKCEDRISLWENGRGVPGLTNILKLSLLYRATPMQLYAQLMDEIEESLEEIKLNL